MNSIWNKNLSLFIQRFPALAKIYSLNSDSDIPPELPDHLLAPIEILPSKQNLPTAKDNGKFLHSAYNPQREGEQAALGAKESLEESSVCLFFSCGLGYAPISYAQKFPQDTLIIVEPDPRYFFTALSLVDWSPVFSLANCIIALQSPIEGVTGLIEHYGGLKHTAISENPAQSAHAADYFSALRSLIQRNKRKNDINTWTLEKFSRLWLKNTCRNLPWLLELDGINIFEKKLPPDLPVLILAAGPSLEEILPHLAELKKRCIIVAVDTALRACLKNGVEADFIVLSDPQYWAYRHIAGLSSPSSILITESAAYPALFRFPCKKKLMISSLFPLGQYIESKIGNKGQLVAGGSVSTTAWDFARFAGAREIFLAGLDLGYPSLQTHIRGSTFEEAAHSKSGRFNPAEKFLVSSLYGADVVKAENYLGEKILSDSKMKMFAWWFESKAEEFKDSITSTSLSSKSLKIPGFKWGDVKILLERPEAPQKRSEFLSLIEKEKSAEEKNRQKSLFQALINDLNKGLAQLYDTAKKGESLSDKGIGAMPNQYTKFSCELAKIDSQIMNSRYKEIVSLVFPTEGRLEKLMKDLPAISDPIRSSFQKSRLIYRELIKSIRDYQKYLNF